MKAEEDMVEGCDWRSGKKSCPGEYMRRVEGNAHKFFGKPLFFRERNRIYSYFF